jgi:anti-sigma factor RsiW
MPCESHKDALIHAAASGGAVHVELQAHLASCAPCRATFAEEQSLFAAIDSGLYAAANAEVPASLLPCVRARYDEAATTKPIWTTNGFGLTAATAVAVALLAAQAVWHIRVGQTPVATAGKTSLPQVVPAQQRLDSVALEPARRNSASPRRSSAAKNSVPIEALVNRNTRQEVLVPPDQEVVLARYAEQWRQRKRVPLLAENPEDTALAPLQVALIQIAQLDVKLLAEEKSQ